MCWINKGVYRVVYLLYFYVSNASIVWEGKPIFTTISELCRTLKRLLMPFMSGFSLQMGKQDFISVVNYRRLLEPRALGSNPKLIQTTMVNAPFRGSWLPKTKRQKESSIIERAVFNESGKSPRTSAGPKRWYFKKIVNAYHSKFWFIRPKNTMKKS